MKISKKYLRVFITFFSFLVCGEQLGAQPRTQSRSGSRSTAIVEYIIDEQHIMAISDAGDWTPGEILPIISQNVRVGVFAYAEVESVKFIRSGRYELKLQVLRQSRRYLIQQNDYVKRLRLESENRDYVGTTDLLVKSSDLPVSSRYKPLVYQGFFIGETAQSLYKNEFLINYLGNAFFGVHDDITIGSFLPLNILTGANGSLKAKFYDSESTTLAASLNYVDVRNDHESTLNLNLYWDSVSSDTLLSHVYLSLALLKWEGTGDTAAIKALGSSSFQTGYEVIMSNWNRFLIGPSYNFDTKALGGYLSYVWIYDRFHAQISLNTTNVTQLKIKSGDGDGYFGFFDVYWRF